MALDGIVIANLRHEIDSKLSEGRIQKISMPDKDELVINIKNNRNIYKLLISANASLPLMYLTEESKTNPMTAPNFCMLLRKYVGNARISKLSGLGLERIICIHLEHLDELGDPASKKLYVEIMGKHSNIIFTDDNDVIIDSIKKIGLNTSSIREILPGRTYFLPEELKKKELLDIDDEEFHEVLKNSAYPLYKALYMYFTGISPLVSEEICYRASLSTESDCKSLSTVELTHLQHIIKNIMSDIKNNVFYPNIVYKDGVAVEFASLELEMYKNDNYTIQKFDSISELIYEYYSSRDRHIRIKQRTAELRKLVSNLLDRNEKKYALQAQQLKDTEKKDKFKVYGDLINTYGYELSGGEEVLVCANYYDDNKEIKIKLDPTLSSKDNATKYYEKYAKLKRTFDAVSEEIKNTEMTIEHLSSILNSLDYAIEDNDLTQIKNELIEYGFIKKTATNKAKSGKKLLSKPLHYISSDGFHIYVGKNNYQNEELSFSFANNNDWWFHAKGIPGSHVILKTDNKEPTDRAYEEAAALAAYYSKAGSADKVEVDYIQRKQLKKVPSSIPGFVIYHSNWSMSVKPDNDLRLVE